MNKAELIAKLNTQLIINTLDMNKSRPHVKDLNDVVLQKKLSFVPLLRVFFNIRFFFAEKEKKAEYLVSAKKSTAATV